MINVNFSLIILIHISFYSLITMENASNIINNLKKTNSITVKKKNNITITENRKSNKENLNKNSFYDDCYQDSCSQRRSPFFHNIL
jgi:hypothetical protein